MSGPTGEDTLALASAVHLERVAGRFASNLEELRIGIESAPPEVLFVHTQAPRLGEGESAEAPGDDFSRWTGTVVQDVETAERMAFALQTCDPGHEPARAVLLASLTRLSEEERRKRDAPPGGEFVFRAADSVPLPTGVVVGSVDELMSGMVNADLAVWFHHLIAEPWLEPGGGSLLAWLERRARPDLVDAIRSEIASGRGIRAVRERLLRRWRRRNLGRRLVEAAAETPESRQASQQAAAAALARRLHPPRTTP